MAITENNLLLNKTEETRVTNTGNTEPNKETNKVGEQPASMRARTKGILRKGDGPYGSPGGLSIHEGYNRGNDDGPRL